MKSTISGRVTHFTVILLTVISIITVVTGAFFEKSSYLASLCNVIDNLSYDLNFFIKERGINSISELEKEKDSIGEILQSFSMMEDVKYTYIMVPSADEKEKYYFEICDSTGPVVVDAGDSNKRKAGTVIQSELNVIQREVWQGDKNSNYYKIDNVFGKSYTFVSAVKNTNGERIALACVDVNIDDFYTSLFNSAKYKIGLFVLLIVTFAVGQHFVIKKLVYKPLEKTEKYMSEFLKDGNTTVSLPETQTKEFENINRAFIQMEKNTDEHIREIEKLSRQKAETDAEISVAGEIQKSILPLGFFSGGSFEIHAMLKSAVNVSGDFYDYYYYDEDRIMIAIGDVSGKGIAASMFMARTFLLLRVYLYIEKDIKTALEAVNNELYASNTQNLFVTLFVATYDTKTKKLEYCNAGHNIPYLIGDKLIPLDGSRNLLLGMFENEKYPSAETTLKENDTLFIYTDGVSEAQNENKEFYSTERLEKRLSELKDDYIVGVYNDVRKFSGNAVQYDDITMLTLSVCEKKTTFPSKAENFSIIKEKCFEAVGEDKRSNKSFLEMMTVLEEVFVNICNYAYEGKVGEVEFSVSYLGDEMVCKISDKGVKFNPLTFESDSYSQNSADNLLIGGQGIHLIKALSDKLHYNCEHGKNTLTISKTVK